ncbi:zinc finger protein Eos isoform X1 [Alosa alosa]|uniref:zinc finger protein Eos isoform X1 n=1 Tax=Alosa alosa TaxID=278164 RepID=UPI00201546CB|nr:zinc finger protein Eos isoform X1 [Alosa alosa]
MLRFYYLAGAVIMNADDCNGRSYMSGSGDSSTEREFFAGLRGPTVSTPNSQHSSPSRSLSANSIKVELYSDEEAGGAPPSEKRGGEREEGWKEEKGDTAEEGAGETGVGVRAQVGSGYGEMTSPESVSPGPIRLPNGKLKCDVCGMICIGPNVLMVHKRSHTGERPFQCNQCGASFTQKGNLLRHIKLHSGEKPFKCPFCNYACRRRDALTGHLRTHSVSSPTVGKPYKCSFCGRSYKQQSTLEEHRERCHSYLQSLDHQPAHSTQTQGEENRNMDMVTDPLLQPSTDKMTFIDRLANSITKRKRSTPQKFLGEKHMRLNLSDAPYELTSSPEKDRGDMLGSDHGPLGRLGGRYLRGQRVGVGETGEEAEPRRPLRLPPSHAPCLSEFPPIIGSVYSSHMAPSLGPRMNCVSASGAGGGGMGLAGLPGREAGEGHEDAPTSRSHTTMAAAAESPSNGCHDSTDTESMAEEQCGGGGAGGGTGGQGGSHHNTPLRGFRDRHCSPSHAKDIDLESDRDRERERERDRVRERELGLAVPQAASSLAATPAGVKEGSPRSPPSSSSLPCREALQVVDGEGRQVRSFRCEHCRILFLDHVMFTIHMGCHGFRQPFECNICGHRSQDRYEFSSHIVRGEHQVG